jgi:hypothetical protein
MFIRRFPYDDDGCPPEMLSCMATEHSALNQLAAVGNTTAIIPDLAPPLQHFAASNYIGLIIVSGIIACGLSIWGIRVLWRNRAQIRRARMGEKQQPNMTQEDTQWLDGMGEGVAQPLRVLDMNEILHGKGEERTSSTPWRSEETCRSPHTVRLGLGNSILLHSNQLTNRKEKGVYVRTELARLIKGSVCSLRPSISNMHGMRTEVLRRLL